MCDSVGWYVRVRFFFSFFIFLLFSFIGGRGGGVREVVVVV